ncbi:MAG: HPr family phosphocarrier protein [Acholeplasmataceae bacterium]
MTFEVIHEKGIHARPAMELVLLADQFDEAIYIEADGRRVDNKSIMGLMSLGMYKGQIFTLEVNGPNEKDVLDKLSNLLIDSGLAKRI